MSGQKKNLTKNRQHQQIGYTLNGDDFQIERGHFARKIHAILLSVTLNLQSKAGHVLGDFSVLKPSEKNSG